MSLQSEICHGVIQQKAVDDDILVINRLIAIV